MPIPTIGLYPATYLYPSKIQNTVQELIYPAKSKHYYHLGRRKVIR